MVVLGWILFAIVVGFAADARGRSGFGYFFLSLLLSPLIGLILVLVSPNLAQEQARADERNSDRAFQRDLAIRSAPAAPQGSAADEIEKLLSLKERGALTDEEFTAEKTKALSRSGRSAAASRADVPISVEDCDALLASRGYKVRSRPDGTFDVVEPLGGVARIKDLEMLVLYARARQLHRNA